MPEQIVLLDTSTLFDAALKTCRVYNYGALPMYVRLYLELNANGLSDSLSPWMGFGIFQNQTMQAKEGQKLQSAQLTVWSMTGNLLHTQKLFA